LMIVVAGWILCAAPSCAAQLTGIAHPSQCHRNPAAREGTGKRQDRPAAGYKVDPRKLMAKWKGNTRLSAGCAEAAALVQRPV
jgi:hypothetical protein